MSHWSLPRDPRYYQIAVLSGLLAYGMTVLGFEIEATRVALILGACLLLQGAFGHFSGAPGFEPKSALISGLSLCLLLRTPRASVALLAATLAIGSKFLLRYRGKHLFNPTNFGIVATVILTSGGAWISPGQWGAGTLVGFLVACLGMGVVHRALRSDVTLAFLSSYALLLFGRALYLGDPLAIPRHQLQSGSLLLFAFFMISDPRTTPDSRAGRILFACAVTAIAGYLQFARYRPVAMLPALLYASPLVPVLDRLLRSPRYLWPGGGEPEPSKGAFHAPPAAAHALSGTALS